MLLEEFGKKVCDAMKEVLGEEYEVAFKEVTKNNGVSLHGVLINKKGSNVSPAIYIDELLDDYEAGRAFGDIIYDILLVYRRHAREIRMDMDFFMQFEQVKGRILYKLIHRDSNRKLLEEIPYIEWNDLALVFYYVFEDERFGKASILVRNSHLDMWKVNVSVLHENAQANMVRLRPAQMLPVKQVIQEMIIQNYRADEPGSVPTEKFGAGSLQESMMYMLSNNERMFGAAAILYAESLKALTGKLGKNLIILPSSVHEVLLVPDDGIAERGFYKDMVREVNDTQVEPEERLSYNVYYYDRVSEKITIF